MYMAVLTPEAPALNLSQLKTPEHRRFLAVAKVVTSLHSFGTDNDDQEAHIFANWLIEAAGSSDPYSLIKVPVPNNVAEIMDDIFYTSGAVYQRGPEEDSVFTEFIESPDLPGVILRRKVAETMNHRFVDQQLIRGSSQLYFEPLSK